MHTAYIHHLNILHTDLVQMCAGRKHAMKNDSRGGESADLESVERRRRNNHSSEQQGKGGGGGGHGDGWSQRQRSRCSREK